MWVRVDKHKIPLMARCRVVTTVEGTREPEMGEGVSFWDKPDTKTEHYEIWVEGRVEDNLPRKAYLNGFEDGIRIVKKRISLMHPDAPDDFKDA